MEIEAVPAPPHIITIAIDTRERSLWELAQFYIAKDPRIEFVQVPLELGDAEIRVEAQPRVLFERKTHVDLAQSLKDGRYKEQKSRILSAWDPRRVFYLVEGPHPNWFQDSGHINGLSFKVYTGMVFNTTLRDGIHIAFTKNPTETFS